MLAALRGRVAAAAAAGAPASATGCRAGVMRLQGTVGRSSAGTGRVIVRPTVGPGRAQITCRRTFSNSTEAVEEEGWSLRARLIFFSVFVTAGGLGTLSYTLNTDEEMLFYVYDNYPAVVTTLGPWIGLPMVEETGQLDEDEYFPRDVTELVGNTVSAAVKLRSGRVVIIQAPSETSSVDIEKLVLEKLGVPSLHGDAIVNVSFIDEEEQTEVLGKSEDQLRDAFAIQIEPLPEPGTAPKAALEALLQVYRMNELEFKTQVQLGINHKFDTSQYEQALKEIERRKAACKEMIKTAPR